MQTREINVDKTEMMNNMENIRSSNILKELV